MSPDMVVIMIGDEPALVVDMRRPEEIGMSPAMVVRPEVNNMPGYSRDNDRETTPDVIVVNHGTGNGRERIG